MQQAGALTDSIHSVRSQMVAAQDDGAGPVRRDRRRPAATSTRSPPSWPSLNKTISSFLQNGDSPNDLMDRRDLLLDQLSGYGQISVEQLDGGSMNVSFVDARDRHRRTRSSPTRPRPGPARRPAAGTRAARWAAC